MHRPPTRYQVLLRSAYRYSTPVPFARHALRLIPHDTVRQRVGPVELRIAPEPRERNELIDFFGNRVVQVAIEQPHQAFEIELTANVAVHSFGVIDPESSPSWESIRAATVVSRDAGPLGPGHYLGVGAHTAANDELVDFARSYLTPGRPVLAAAWAMARAIQQRFAYVPGATDVTTTASAAWSLRQGVCQDFAHLMLAALRSIGLPAAYVSGLLRTRPPPGEARLEGADAMHAWVSVWAGEHIGWVDIDPTNGLMVDTDHIRIAVGREYDDVAPIDGVIVVSGEQSHTVAVDVIALDN